MNFDKYSMYSVLTENEVKNEASMVKVMELLENLGKFDTEKDVRAFFKDNFGIKDDIRNFSVAQNVELTMSNSSKYFNVTVKAPSEVKSYNYNK